MSRVNRTGHFDGKRLARVLVDDGEALELLPIRASIEDENAGTQIRRDLMYNRNLHTILKLPTGIF